MEEKKAEQQVEEKLTESAAMETEKKEEAKETKKSKINWKDKHFQNIVLAVSISFAIFSGLAFAGWTVYQKNNYIGEKAAKEKVEKFVKENLLPEGSELEIKEIKKKDGLYEAKLTVAGMEYVSYLTGSGEVFFPQGMNIKETEETVKKQKEEQEKIMNVEVPKSDKPKVEVFVMSYCPFGTQVQKGMIPVMETLKDKAEIEFKYVDYAMHGDKEIDENLNQYCISQKEPAKYLGYLKCFLKAGDSKSCLNSERINQVALASCVKEQDTKFSIKQKAADKATWSNGQFPPFDLQKEDNDKYNVQGSPTVIINGTEVPGVQRDANSLLKKVCSAFNNPPQECQTELSSAVPASGFGEETAAAGASAADCSE